jgi:hypothetical protein
MPIHPKSKRAIIWVQILVLVAAIPSGVALASPGPLKNVIVLIPDGLGGEPPPPKTGGDYLPRGAAERAEVLLREAG